VTVITRSSSALTLNIFDVGWRADLYGTSDGLAVSDGRQPA
jgi:hypothetical protein